MTRCTKAQPVKDCIEDTIAKFLFEYVLTRFGCLKVLMSDRGMQFLNERISMLNDEFKVYHQKSKPYHLKADGKNEAFNNILDNALTNICNTQWND